MLHEQLEQQDQQVLGRLENVQKELTAASTGIETERTRGENLRQQVEVQQSGLVRSEDELTARRAKVVTAAQEADASRTELARLTADLERMERCVADLKAARQRQQQMVSLVPYRGKRGDDRKPVYIECNGENLIFHPERVSLQDSRGAVVREEIERRLDRQRAETKSEKEEAAYLLMLVRPNGITTYYRTLAALKGLRVDFGYEFIDQDWILDFSEDNDKVKKQPWTIADRAKDHKPSVIPKKEAASVNPPFGRTRGTAQPGLSQGTALGRPVGILAASTGLGNPRLGIGGPTPTGNPGSSFAGNGSGNDGTSGQPVGFPRAHGKSVLGSGAGPSLADVLAGGGRSGRGSSAALDGSPVTVSPDGPGQSELLGSGVQAAPGTEAPRAAVAAPSPRPAVSQAPLTGGIARSESEAGETREPVLDVPPSLPPVTQSRSKTAGSPGLATSPDAANGPAPAGPTQGTPLARRNPNPDAAPDGRETHPPTSSGGLVGDPLDRFRDQNPATKQVRATPVRPGPLIGNRDWIIAIECTADALVLLPSRQRIATAQLSRGENGKNALLEAVQQMIARRQATVRPGEPPYRPMIRFRVLSDGLRSYHLAYPALETLHVPMARENVDLE
jgi:hypothetical protein